MSFRLLARKPVEKEYLDYSSANVTTGAWVQVVAATSQPCSAVEIFNGSSATIKIAAGGAGSEVEIPYYILPGGSSILLPLEFAKGSRISLKALDQTAATGLFIINLFG